ncbi:MAG TPA: biopolymer transporter ExbD [Burkholderiaceae bacterium]|jgi:biopolymer transport protein ExbD|nr:biopolymer transporter ExbD [Burkholderiaceae bacterium]
MNFRKPRPEDPEINLIPFIDVLLVVLIFLMLSTTYSKFTELQVTLPSADADVARDRPAEIIVSVSADGHYTVDHHAVDGRNVDLLTGALRTAADTRKDPFLIISADAMATHQSVVNILDAARRAGLVRMTFAAQTSSATGAGQ